MKTTAHPYELYATLLDYPTEGLMATVDRCLAELARRNAIEAAETLEGFAARIAGKNVWELEELYARVFDLSPERCLDLGYQVFGETYKRGSFLVKMKQAALAHDLGGTVELPDHLTVVLRLLPRLAPIEEPGELVSEAVLPTIEKVLRTFSDDGGGYRALLDSLKRLLMADFGVTVVDVPREAEPASATVGERGGKKLPMFPGFNPPSQRTPS
jgi:nitrate reductase molybdenum cofactor assembly chaperone NarJ/NarW